MSVISQLTSLSMDASLATTKLAKVGQALPDLKKIDQARKSIQRIEQGIKNYNKAFQDSQKLLYEVNNKLGKALPELNKLKKTTVEISKVATKAQKLAEGVKKFQDLLNNTVFKKVAPPKAGILLSSLSALASAGAIVMGAKTGEEVQQYDLNKEAIVNNDLNRQLNLTIKQKNRIDRIEKTTTANSAAIDTLSGYVGERTQYTDRQLAEIKIQVDTANQNAKSATESLPLLQAKTSQLQQQQQGLQQQQQVQVKEVEKVKFKLQQMEIRDSIPDANEKQVLQALPKLLPKIQQLEQKVEKIEKQPFPAALTTKIQEATTKAGQAIAGVEQIRQGKLPPEALGTITKLVDGKIEITRKNADELARDIGLKIDKKANKDEVVTTVELGGQVIRITEPIIRQTAAEITAGNAIELGGVKRDLQTQQKEIADINRKVGEQDTMNREGLGKLGEIVTAIGLLPPLIARVPDQTLGKIKPIVPSSPDIARIVKQNTPQSPDIGQIVRNNTPQQVCRFDPKPINNHTTVLDIAQTALITNVNNTVNTVNTKLGAELRNGGISSAIKRIFDNAATDKIVNYLTFVATMHNALMLSNSIAQTLFSAIDNLASLVGINMKDAEGNQINFSQSIKNTATNWLKLMFGEETIANVNKTWNAANRIYQAASNMYSSMRSMWDSARSIGEWTAENTGKIGNALKKFGVVGDNAYRWMPEQVNAQSQMMQRLENLEEAASGIEMITSEVVSIQDNLKEIKEQREEFDKAIKDVLPKERVDNEPVKKAKEEAKESSKALEVKGEDKEPDEDATT